MANRYWVGGTGTWDAANTANWSATSGGAGGASAPTTADNVFFNSASNATAYTVITVTGASCADMTMAGPASGNVAWTHSGTLNVAGSMTIAATGVTRSGTGSTTFSATTSGKTVTTNGLLLFTTTFNGVGGVWTLGSAYGISSTGQISISNGTLDTSTSNYSLSTGNLVVAAGGTVNFNASTITIGSNTVSFTGTVNAGTSTLSFGNPIAATLTAIGKTLYNVSVGAGTPSLIINGPLTVNNLTSTASGFKPISLDSTLTINGTLSATSSGAISRTFFFSDTFGTARSIVLANAPTTTNCDFRDITAVTNAITATGGGDCGGNTNITGFPAPKTVYWNLAGVQNWTATGWATSSGGTPAAANFPLAQDTAVFDNTGSVTGTITINNEWNIGTINMSGRTTAMTLATSTRLPNIYGSWLNGTGTTLTGTGIITFAGRGNTQQIFGNGVSFTQPILVQNIGGTVQLTGALTLGPTLTFTHTNGTLNLQSYTLTTGLFSSTNSNTRTIAFGTGNITVNGTGTVWTTSTTTGLTTTGTQVVNVSNNSATATTVSSGSPTEANSISFNFTTGTYALTHTAGAKRSLNFTGFAGTVTNTSQTIYGDLTLDAAATYTAGTVGWTFASTSGTPRTVTTNGETMDFPLTFNGVGGTWVLQDALTIGSTRVLTQTNGTLDLNGKTLTVGAVGSGYSTGIGTKNLTFNGGTLVCPGASTLAFNNAAPTGFTTTAGTGTGTISMTAATAKTFAGGGSTFNCTLNQGGAGALTIIGSNTFNNITNTVQPASVLFTAGTTTTFNNFNLNGTAGNLVTIASVTAATHTLSKASGTVSCDYLSITNSIATGGASWYAGANSTNVSGNTGWIFTASPVPKPGNFMMFFSGV